MKHSWYDLYKLSNALPFDIGTTESRGNGLNHINKRMTPETATTEKTETKKYIASGEGGVVVDIGNNKVRKYTFKKHEAEKAQSLIGNTKYPVVKVYSVKKIQEKEDSDIWAIDMERVTPLTRANIPEKEEDLIWHIFHRIISDGEEIKNWPQFAYEYICLESWNRDYESVESIPDEVKKRISSYYDNIKSLKCLNEINLLWDCSAWNVGIDSNGKWVLFDLE